MTLNSTNISIIKRLLGGHNSRPLRSILQKIEAQDLTRLYNILNDREIRQLADALLSIEKFTDTLLELPPPQLLNTLEKIEPQKRITTFTQAPEDDVSYILSLYSNEKQAEILEQIPGHRRSRLKQLLSYPKESAGRIMNTKVFTLTIDLNAGQAIERYRSHADEVSIYYIYCVDEDQRLMGVLSLRELVSSPEQTPLIQLIKKDVVSVNTHTDEGEVAQLVSHYDFIALPVVDDSNVLKGVITVDEVVDIIQEQATADIYAHAGLQEDDRVYSTARFSIKNRLPWMLLNLVLAVIVSSVVSLFEETMRELIILASIKNVVAGVGGNTAIQTLTVVTRGLATGDFNFVTYRKVLIKEMTVGLVMGFITGIFSGAIIYMWKGSLSVSVIICISMILNSLVATFMGSIVPVFLKRMNYDPASGSGVLVTFMTDSFGFFSFLGIASLCLKYLS